MVDRSLSDGGTRLSVIRLWEPVVQADPYPLYQQFQAAGPLVWDPILRCWVCSHYAVGREVLQQPHWAAARVHPTGERPGLDRAERDPLYRLLAQQLRGLDPLDPPRSPISAIFSARRLGAWHTPIARLVEQLLDQVASPGSLDVVQDLAGPLPIHVLGMLLGIPAADHPRLQQWADDYATLLGRGLYPPEQAATIRHSLEALPAYLHALIQPHRAAPAEALALPRVWAAMTAEGVTADTVVAHLILLLAAGQETTTPGIGNGVWTLIRHPIALAALRAAPAPRAEAVEEVLRFERPAQFTARIARRDCAVAGQPVQAGQGLLVLLGAANRDPARFADPDRLDLRRPANAPLVFTYGAHVYLRAALARLEIQIALRVLIQRWPSLLVASPSPAWGPHPAQRGLRVLPVHWSLIGEPRPRHAG